MTPRKLWLASRTPLTMLLLLGFVLGVAAWGYAAVMKPIPKRPPDPCTVVSVGPNYTSQNAWIRIYNGTNQGGLAKNVVKLIFGNAGFHVLLVKNADAPIDKTYIAGVDANSPEVVLVRSYLPAGTPVVVDPVTYQDHTVALFLGADFKAANINPKPTTAIPMPDGKACVPQQYKASADS